MTPSFVKCIRTMSLVVALALPTVALQAPSANAKQTSTPRKDCTRHLNQYKANMNVAKAWASYAQTMLSLGYVDEAQQATTWAEAYGDLAQDAIGQYAACL